MPVSQSLIIKSPDDQSLPGKDNFVTLLDAIEENEPDNAESATTDEEFIKKECCVLSACNNIEELTDIAISEFPRFHIPKSLSSHASICSEEGYNSQLNASTRTLYEESQFDEDNIYEMDSKQEPDKQSNAMKRSTSTPDISNANSLVIVIEPSIESEENKIEIDDENLKKEEITKVKRGLSQSQSSYSFTSFDSGCNSTYNTASLDRKFTSSTTSMVNLCQSQLYVNRPKTFQIQSSIRVRLLQEKIFDNSLKRSASDYNQKRNTERNSTNLQQSFFSTKQKEIRNRQCKSLIDDVRFNEGDIASSPSIKDLIKKFENQSMK